MGKSHATNSVFISGRLGSSAPRRDAARGRCKGWTALSRKDPVEQSCSSLEGGPAGPARQGVPSLDGLETGWGITALPGLGLFGEGGKTAAAGGRTHGDPDQNPLTPLVTSVAYLIGQVR